MNLRIPLLLLFACSSFASTISDSQTLGFDPLIVASANAVIETDLRVQTQASIKTNVNEIPYKRGSGSYEFSLWVITDGPVRSGVMLLGASCFNGGLTTDSHYASVVYRDGRGDNKICGSFTEFGSRVQLNSQFPVILGEPIQFVFSNTVSGVNAASETFLILQGIYEPTFICSICYAPVAYRVQETIPEPASLILYGSGIFLLIGANRIRMKHGRWLRVSGTHD